MILCILRPNFFFSENDFFKPTHSTKVRKILHFFFEQFWKNYFFTLENAKTLRKILNFMLTECFLHPLYGWHDAWRTADKMRSVADIMHGTANTMLWCGWRNACEVWWVAQNHWPPHMAKNEYLLNEYLGIFVHFESIFFIF